MYLINSNHLFIWMNGTWYLIMCFSKYIWRLGVPKKRWSIMENSAKMHDLGVPPI